MLRTGAFADLVMLDPDRVRALVRAALDEDLGRGDLTTEVTVPESACALKL